MALPVNGVTRPLAWLLAALALAAPVAAQMSSDSWSTDPALVQENVWHAGHVKAGPDFPLPAYGAIGSSLAQTGHFTELKWAGPQIGAFVDGMRAVFQGGPLPLDDGARQFLEDMSRRAAGQAAPEAGQPTSAGLPLPSCAALGSFIAMAAHFAELGWNPAQSGAFLDGARGALEGRPVALDPQARRLLADLGREIADIGELRKLEAPGSLDEEGRIQWYMGRIRLRLGLQLSSSGLAYRVETGRGGTRPRPDDTIVFTCTATAADGVTRLPQMSGTRIRMTMAGLLPGLMEGIQMMTIDGNAVFAIPPQLSFGNNPWPEGVQKGMPVIMNVTLIDVVAAKPSP